MTVHFHSVFLATVALSLSLASACSDKFVDCEQRKACLASGGASTTDSGDSDGTGGDEGEGGAHSGGATTSGDGDGDTSSSGGMVIDPCDACEGETPVCVDDECVACSDQKPGICQVNEHCSLENTCVECLDNSHCTEPGASVCDLDTNECTGCSVNDDCAHLTETTLCAPESASCVACLTADDCDGNVCDPSSHTCTDLSAGTEVACEPCQYDAQCVPGQVCVEMSYSDPTDGVVGSFCLWRMAAALPGPNGSCGLNSRPYAQKSTITTIDGETNVEVCQPATTTCPAILQHRTTVTGCETEFEDDTACGAATFNDGRCRNNSSDQPKCTYPCGGNEDCRAGFTCTTGDQYCSL